MSLSDKDQSGDLIGLYHTKGVNPCNGLAFWYSAYHYRKQWIMVAVDVENIDGTTPLVRSIPRCGACGYFLSNILGQEVTPSRLQE